MKEIRDYLPVHAHLTLLQCRVDKNILDKTRIIMRRMDINWRQVLEACLSKFVDEMSEKGAVYGKKKADPRVHEKLDKPNPVR